MSKKFAPTACALAASCLCACAPASRTAETTPLPPVAPVQTSSLAPADRTQNPGSLFSGSQAEYLFADNRARRVGDVVLVQIVESSAGKNKADTKTNKETSLNMGVQNLFGNKRSGIVPFGNIRDVQGAVGATPMVQAGTASDFDAKGETTREGNLSATVACRVTQVMAGNLMQVEGAREIRVNEENQIIAVRGLVRPRDIQADNTVPSSYLADARIEYFGQGVLADKNRPGWLTRILDNVWPF